MKKRIEIYVRLSNFIVDSLVFAVLIFVIILCLKHSNQQFIIYNETNSRLIAFSVYFSYYFILELSFQVTPGKLVSKTKVVDSQSLRRPSFYKFLIRTACRFIPLEFVLVFFSESHKSLHDILSGTVLIYNN